MTRVYGRTLIWALVALLGLGLTLFGTARAHAELVESTPADGETRDQAPDTVVARFSEEVVADGSSLVVTDADGNVVDQGDSRLDTSDAQRTTLVVSLRDDLGSGTYTVAWTAVAADGHPQTGTFSFTVAAAEEDASPSPDASPEASPEVSPSPEASPDASPSPEASPVSSLPDTGASGSPMWETVALIVGALMTIGLVLRRTLSRTDTRS